MRRIAVLTLVVLAAASSQAQVWEKLVASGLTYRMEFDASAPRVIHAFRWSAGATDIVAVPALANSTVFSEEVAKSRSTVTSIVAQQKAIGGINADFFPWNGDPLGLMVRNGELLSRPWGARGVVAWGSGGSAFGPAEYSGRLMGDNKSFEIDGINEECGPNMLVINTASSGFARSKSQTVMAVLKIVEGALGPNGTVKAEVQGLYSEVSSMPIREGNIVVVGLGTKANPVASLRAGEMVEIATQVKGFDWTKYEHAVGGGPLLLRNGKLSDTWAKEGFKDDFTKKRHPRTAVGRTASGEVWFVAIDGRQSMSVGATLEETAHVMLKLGCVDAVNLDGGGSTAINLFGLTLNRPSDGTERPVANGVVFQGNGPQPNGDIMSIWGPETLPISSATTLTVRLDSGDEIPNNEIVWSSSGNAWIDQGGTVRPLNIGQVSIRAFARGKVIQRTYEIVKDRR